MNKKRLLIATTVLSVLALGINALLLQGSDIESQNLGLGQVEKEEGESSSTSTSSSSSSKTSSSSSEVRRDPEATKEYMEFSSPSAEELRERLTKDKFTKEEIDSALEKLKKK